MVKKLSILALSFLLLFRVQAASVNYSSVTTDVGYARCSPETGCEHVSTGFKEMGQVNTIPTGQYGMPEILEIHGRVFGGSSYTYNAGNTYQAKFTLKIRSNFLSYNQLTEQLRNQLYVVRLAGNTTSSSSGQSGTYIEKFGWSLAKGTTDNTFYLTITFVPSVNIKFMTYYFASKNFDDFQGVFANSVQVTALELSYSTGTTGAIDQQTQIIQQQTDIINNSINNIGNDITDTNVDDSINTGTNFFTNFSENSHGLTGIITSPLVSINKMLDTNCSPIHIPVNLNNKNSGFDLPCGDFFFKSPKVDALGFAEFLNLFLGGLLCYSIGLSIFKLVEKFKDPESDKVEVLDL